MKKIFTLIAMAFVAMSVNAQDVDPNNLYPAKEIVMDDIHWYSGPQAKALKNMTIDKTDINDEAGTKLYNVLGDGNAYKDGHFIPALNPTFSMASAMATAAIRVHFGASWGRKSGFNITENQMPPLGQKKLRSRRPLPVFWLSATTMVPSGDP